jgi:hypothetical protein
MLHVSLDWRLLTLCWSGFALELFWQLLILICADINSSWVPRLGGSSEGGRITDFIEGLGPGQLVGRQVLASPSLGDIQLSMCDRRGGLEVEVIRARGLQGKTGSKVTNKRHSR